MRAGLLRHRVAIQTNAETRSPTSGQLVKEWVTENTVWASVEPLKGEKLVQAQQVCPRVTHEVQLRGRVLLSTKRRFLFEGRALNIGHYRDEFERGIKTIALAIEVPV